MPADRRWQWGLQPRSAPEPGEGKEGREHVPLASSSIEPIPPAPLPAAGACSGREPWNAPPTDAAGCAAVMPCSGAKMTPGPPAPALPGNAPPLTDGRCTAGKAEGGSAMGAVGAEGERARGGREPVYM
jgi:hypothetical protein